MQLDVFSGIIYQFCTWFARLAYINLLWIFFSIVGLFIFGFFPATIAMFATLRQFLNKNHSPVFKTFWKYYKKEFVFSNKLGLIIVIISFFFYLNITFLQTNIGVLHLLYYPMILLSLLFVLSVCYLFACCVHFNQNIGILLKNAVLIMVYNPLPNLFIIFGSTAVYYAIVYIPGISFFYSGSLIALVILSSATFAFNKVEHDQNQLLMS
ncbi:YesL family protein [Salipaludibacillus sp. CF4.18]|uniref:YesL family protein n=1 Tax=Salipaludibacillus sp. CF4.18 TaxID=3373081 RepID=UPI003EE5528A